jgi:hypothetical protein
MRPWIAVAYSAPVAAATAVFLIYPIGQGSFSDGMPLGKVYCPTFIQQKVVKKRSETRLNGRYLFLYFLQNFFKIFNFAFLKAGRNADKANLDLARQQQNQKFPFFRVNSCSVFETDQRGEAQPFSAKQEDRRSIMENAKEEGRVIEEVIEEECINDNSVSNQIQPRKQPGLYMIRCKVNDKRYYGESKNVSGRLASHKSQLNRKIHPNSHLQHDWNTFGEDCFQFNVLFMGSSWEKREERIAKETLLIIQDRHLCYNYLEGQSRPTTQNPFYQKKHTDETNKKIGDAMRGIPNDKLGKAITLDGVIYPSLAEASRITKHSRKFIRKRLENPNDSGCTEI